MLKQKIWEDLNPGIFKVKEVENTLFKKVDCIDVYLDAVGNSINNILKTNQYEMVGHPEFGCDLRQFLFSQLDIETKILIEEYIKSVLLKFEPRVNVSAVDVIEAPDYNAIYIDVKFRIKNDTSNKEFTSRVPFSCP